jgi:hypothetical protein
MAAPKWLRGKTESLHFLPGSGTTSGTASSSGKFPILLNLTAFEALFSGKRNGLCEEKNESTDSSQEKLDFFVVFLSLLDVLIRKMSE